jgi:hypothetical protein
VDVEVPLAGLQVGGLGIVECRLTLDRARQIALDRDDRACVGARIGGTVEVGGGGVTGQTLVGDGPFEDLGRGIEGRFDLAGAGRGGGRHLFSAAKGRGEVHHFGVGRRSGHEDRQSSGGHDRRSELHEIPPLKARGTAPGGQGAWLATSKEPVGSRSLASYLRAKGGSESLFVNQFLTINFAVAYAPGGARRNRRHFS